MRASRKQRCSYCLMNRVFSSVTLLYQCAAPPVAAQVFTLDQLFWLREKPSLDAAEYLEVEHEWRWQLTKDVTLRNSLYYFTNWVFLGAYQKRLAELVYESRGSLSYLLQSSSRVYNALKAQVAAYHTQHVGQQHKRGADWTYFRYKQDYDVGLANLCYPRGGPPYVVHYFHPPSLAVIA